MTICTCLTKWYLNLNPLSEVGNLLCDWRRCFFGCRPDPGVVHTAGWLCARADRGGRWVAHCCVTLVPVSSIFIFLTNSVDDQIDGSVHSQYLPSAFLWYTKGPITNIDAFNPSMEKYLCAFVSVKRNYVSISKRQHCHSDHKLYWAWSYLSTMGFKLFQFSKGAPDYGNASERFLVSYLDTLCSMGMVLPCSMDYAGYRMYRLEKLT